MHRNGKSNANVDGLSRDRGSLTKVGRVSGISILTECEPPRREVGERDVGVHGPVSMMKMICRPAEVAS